MFILRVKLLPVVASSTEQTSSGEACLGFARILASWEVRDTRCDTGTSMKSLSSYSWASGRSDPEAKPNQQNWSTDWRLNCLCTKSDRQNSIENSVLSVPQLPAENTKSEWEPLRNIIIYETLQRRMELSWSRFETGTAAVQSIKECAAFLKCLHFPYVEFGAKRSIEKHLETDFARLDRIRSWSFGSLHWNRRLRSA